MIGDLLQQLAPDQHVDFGLVRSLAERLWDAGMRDCVISIDYATPGRHDR